MVDNNFTHPLVVIDFEATALTPSSYPIEVGVARMLHFDTPIDSWSSLLAPDPSWNMALEWDPDAERLHGIARRDLVNGITAAEAMERLNEIIAPIGQAWCDGGHYDHRWLAALAVAAGVQPRFEFRDINAGIGSDQLLAARYQEVLDRSKPPHRAGPDAARICTALAGLIGPPTEPQAKSHRVGIQEMAGTWKRHDGSDCPTESQTAVLIRFRNGQEAGPGPAAHWRWKLWSIGESDWDIVAWRQP